MNLLSTPQRPTVCSRLEELHRRIRREHPSVDRVACATHDRAHGRLRTFVHSADVPSPLSRYEVRLGDVPSLAELARSRRDRVIDDLLTLEPPLQHHTRQLVESGYRSSLTRPLFVGDELVGFLFLDSRQPGRFTSAAIERLGLFTTAVALLVQGILCDVRLIRRAVRMATELSRARDRETGDHLVRMARYTYLIASGLDDESELDDEAIEFLTLFAPLHDVGKVGVPDDILLKPTVLDAEERRAMQRHVETGAKIVAGLRADAGVDETPHLELLEGLVRHHHESLDGSGYPDGLIGDAIPLAARVVAVADVFDALTTSRPYKPAWPVGEAFGFLREGAGTRFDPGCVEALVGRRAEVEETMSRFAELGPSAAAHDHEWGLPLA